MRTISVLLYRRPELLEQTMGALVNCSELGSFDVLVFSIDGGNPSSKRCSQIAEACAETLSSSGLIDCRVVSHDQNLGVGNHPLWVLNNAFENLGADLNLNLEDDALPKQDLLRMVLWWEEFGRLESPESLLFSGSNHRDFGKGQQATIPEDDPVGMAECAHISSPFCWAMLRQDWPMVKKWWNFKTVNPTGFDWSLSMAMRLNKRLAMHPVLSRCQNIGRSNGEHESEQTFDDTQLGLRYQEREYDGPYKLVARINRSLLGYLDTWMLPEYRVMNETTTKAATAAMEKYLTGFSRAVSIDNVAPCLTFGASHFINELYADVPKTLDFPNPWHIGTFDASQYPTPNELIQGELEMLAFMFGLVLQLKPKLVVETGTNVGIMARALAAGCWVNGFGKVVTSDTNQKMVDYATKVCEGLPVEIRCCPSLDLPELLVADLVFVDSSYESRSKEIKLVKSGAVYVYHDSCAEPWIRPEMSSEEFKVHLDSPRGFSIVRKP